MTFRNLRVLVAAEEMVVAVVALFDERRGRHRLLFRARTLARAEAVPSKHRRAFGGKTIADRNPFWLSPAAKPKRRFASSRQTSPRIALDERSYWLTIDS